VLTKARDTAHAFGLVITRDGRLTQMHDWSVHGWEDLERMVKKPQKIIQAAKSINKEVRKS